MILILHLRFLRYKQNYKPLQVNLRNCYCQKIQMTTVT